MLSFRREARSAGTGASLARVARLRRHQALARRPLRFSPARVALALGTALCLTFLLCIHLIPDRVALRLGDIADREITARRTIRYEDTDATTRLRQDAVDAVERRYRLLPDAKRDAVEASGSVFDVLRTSGYISDNQDLARVAGEIQRQSGFRLPANAVVMPLAKAPQKVRDRLVSVVANVVGRAMDAPLRDDGGDLLAARAALVSDPALAAVPSTLRAAVVAVCRESLTPNRRFDARETAAARAEAAATVARQYRRIAAGQAIVRAGERITQGHLDAFAALGLRNASLDAGAIATIAGLVFLLTGITAAYLHQHQRRLAGDTALLALLCILVVISVAGIKVGSSLLGLNLSGVQFAYLGMMCVASTAMVIALLLSPSVALLVAALLAVASGVVLNNELRFTLITLVSALVGIVAVSTLRNRTDLMRAALILCLSNAALNGVVGQLEGDTLPEIGSGMLWGLVSGGVALMLFFLGVAVFERVFHLTTHLRLLELSDPATPMLQEFR
ncbi:MAG: hypothetical protein ACKO5K_06565, partial [Armatimonadota bacterium]